MKSFKRRGEGFLKSTSGERTGTISSLLREENWHYHLPPPAAPDPKQQAEAFCTLSVTSDVTHMAPQSNAACTSAKAPLHWGGKTQYVTSGPAQNFATFDYIKDYIKSFFLCLPVSSKHISDFRKGPRLISLRHSTQESTSLPVAAQITLQSMSQRAPNHSSGSI